MYDVVFGSVWVKMAVWVLFAFLILQPVAPAFANEGEAASEDVSVSAGTSEALEAAEEETVTEESPEVTVEETAPEMVSQSVVEEEVVLEEEQAPETQEEETATETPDTGSEEAVEEENVVEEGGQEESVVEEGVQEEVTEQPQTEEEENGTTNEEEPATIEEESATTTEETATTTGESVLFVDHNTNELKFDPRECASVGDGAFYCSTPKDAVEFEEDGVFAAPDQDGDMEIFIRVDGEVQQLTHNTIDDNAPYYDALSNRIVWHANYHDRYQIISYDLDDKEETRLTDTSYNNMEPVAYGDITMYQAWMDNNWEIMFRDENGEKRLTQNTLHDVSPSVRGGYIVWQSQFADGWQVAVYDQETEHIEYVRSEDGAKVENPRFVLVYDSTNEAGDVQTLGYDFNNKRSFTLNSIPADLPEELPDPDQTGETRALIQNKQTVRDTEIEDGEPTPTTTPNATSTPTASTTPQHGIGDVDLTSSSTLQVGTSTPIITEIEDIVIPGFETPTTTPEIDHIEDIVIPPVVSTSTAEIR